MVAMGTSLADRAWGRESAVFRITGVLSVIGGWFITAGVAFIASYLITNGLYFGGCFAMACAIVIAIVVLIKSGKDKRSSDSDSLLGSIARTSDKVEIWHLLCEHIRNGNAQRLKFVMETYRSTLDSFMNEKYRPLKRSSFLIDEERAELKRQRKREILAMRRLDPLVVLQRNTWYFLGINSCKQMLYCMKRINEPLKEHIGNNFAPLPVEFHERFSHMGSDVIQLFNKTLAMLQSGDFTDAEKIREDCIVVQRRISIDRKRVLDSLNEIDSNIKTKFLTIHFLQESQELLSCLRHMIRGMNHFAGDYSA